MFPPRSFTSQDVMLPIDELCTADAFIDNKTTERSNISSINSPIFCSVSLTLKALVNLISPRKRNTLVKVLARLLFSRRGDDVVVVLDVNSIGFLVIGVLVLYRTISLVFGQENLLHLVSVSSIRPGVL